MRWLQWATVDLAQGLGGVEVCARSIHRELLGLGIESKISKDPEDLKQEWDVIHTHGSAVPIGFSRRFKGNPTRVHTLHGTTLGRMAACGEWLWPGGYLASARELSGVIQSDVVLGVHGNLWLYRLAQRMGKHCVVSSNGWDPAQQAENRFGAGSGEIDASAALSEDLMRTLGALGSFWVFIGRSADQVKGASIAAEVLSLVPDMKLVAAPGDGFEKSARIRTTGRLSSPQVQTLLQQAGGLLLTSYYEGHPLVVLEALAQGVPVVSTAVGGVRSISSEVEGLIVSQTHDPRALGDAVRAAQQKYPIDEKSRQARAQKNQSILPNWKSVTQVALDAVLKVQHR